MNPELCPLCGQPNRCAMEVEKETGAKQPPCWCTKADFSAELLASVPVQARNQACICSACQAKGAAAARPAAAEAHRG